MKKKIYIVKYGKWDCEEHKSVIIFATFDKSKADKYVKRFMNLLMKWYKYHASVNVTSKRYKALNNITNCWIEKIDLR